MILVKKMQKAHEQAVQAQRALQENRKKIELLIIQACESLLRKKDGYSVQFRYSRVGDETEMFVRFITSDGETQQVPDPYRKPLETLFHDFIGHNAPSTWYVFESGDQELFETV